MSNIYPGFFPSRNTSVWDYPPPPQTILSLQSLDRADHGQNGPWTVWHHQQELHQASENENLNLSQHWAAWKGIKLHHSL